jgi:hypothetical protein
MTFYRKQTLPAPRCSTPALAEAGDSVWFEITNLMIPGENDSPDETAALCDWVLEHWDPMCRCTSPPFTPISRCAAGTWGPQRQRLHIV